MTHWVTCKSIIDTNKLIHVNLDQVVCITNTDRGVEITYAGQDCVIHVQGNAFDILTKGGIIPNA